MRQASARWGVSAALALLVCAWVTGPIGAVETERLAGEYQVKAAYILNFAKFVEWPTTAFASADAPVVIGVYGQDPFGDALDGTIRDKKLGGRPLVIRRATNMADLRTSHIVFVKAGPHETLPALLAQLQGASVLTVGENERFIESGGVVRFDVADGRVGFTIDIGAAGRAQLTISSQLLRLAKVTGQTKR